MESEIQRYIQAEELLVEIDKLQTKCRQEMSEVEQHLAHLIELRQDCQGPNDSD